MPSVFIGRNAESQPRFAQPPSAFRRILRYDNTTLHVFPDVANKFTVNSLLPASRRTGDSPFALGQLASNTVVLLGASTHLQRHPIVTVIKMAISL